MPGASPRKPPRRAGLERPKPRRGGASGQMAAAAAARAGLTGRPSPPRTRFGQRAVEAIHAANRGAPDLQDHHARRQAGITRRLALDPGDAHALVAVQAELLALRRGQVADVQAQQGIGPGLRRRIGLGRGRRAGIALAIFTECG
ncbi:hypothetical protein G6F31_017408 [Rhizopus arrhizus]|nr:hypothetical protein G6F31_017408 [Rhizopus arrhizus]